MMKRYIHLFLLLLLSFMLLIGCSNQADNEAIEETNDTDTQEEATSFPLTVTDATGEEITLENKPEKIISLLPSNTEIAFALGLDEQIIAVTDNDDYPAEVQQKEKIGGYEIDVEKIIALNPDLVLAHDLNVPEGVTQLKDNGVKVIVVKDANNFEEVFQSIELIGTATGVDEAAAQLIENMQAHLEEIADKLSEFEEEKRSVYLEISGEPEIYTAAASTLFDELLILANGNNIFADETGWPQVNEETVIEKNPQVIIALYNYVEDPVGDILKRNGWQDIEAVKNEQVYHVDENIVSRPGPRLTEGVEELAKAIYPELFTN